MLYQQIVRKITKPRKRYQELWRWTILDELRGQSSNTASSPSFPFVSLALTPFAPPTLSKWKSWHLSRLSHWFSLPGSIFSYFSNLVGKGTHPGPKGFLRFLFYQRRKGFTLCDDCDSWRKISKSLGRGGCTLFSPFSPCRPRADVPRGRTQWVILLIPISGGDLPFMALAWRSRTPQRYRSLARLSRPFKRAQHFLQALGFSRILYNLRT